MVKSGMQSNESLTADGSRQQCMRDCVRFRRESDARIVKEKVLWLRSITAEKEREREEPGQSREVMAVARPTLLQRMSEKILKQSVLRGIWDNRRKRKKTRTHQLPEGVPALLAS